MAVPAFNHPCWTRLASGQLPGFQTEHVALKFLLKRLQSEAITPTAKVRELHDFFTKFERLLAKEINHLAK